MAGINIVAENVIKIEEIKEEPDDNTEEYLLNPVVKQEPDDQEEQSGDFTTSSPSSVQLEGVELVSLKREIKKEDEEEQTSSWHLQMFQQPLSQAPENVPSVGAQSLARVIQEEPAAQIPISSLPICRGIVHPNGQRQQKLDQTSQSVPAVQQQINQVQRQRPVTKKTKSAKRKERERAQLEFIKSARKLAEQEHELRMEVYKLKLQELKWKREELERKRALNAMNTLIWEKEMENKLLERRLQELRKK